MKGNAAFEKKAPCNIQAEQSLIMAMMVRPAVIPQIMNVLEPDDFYREAHREIVRSFFTLKEAADFVTVCENLSKRQLLEKVGGREYLASLYDQAILSVGWDRHAEIVKSLAERRRIVQACALAMEEAFQPWGENDEILSSLKAQIREIQSFNSGPDYRDSLNLVREVFKDIDKRRESGDHFTGIRTGLENIDRHIHGLEPRTTTYLAARPSVGKTALALNIADFVAANYPGKVLYFSLESNDIALTRRRLAAHSNVFLSRLRTGDIEDGQWIHLTEAAEALSGTELIIIDKPKFKTVESLVSLSETLAMDGPLSLIVIDHIQRMNSRKRAQNRHLELSWISEQISSLANDLNVPILILCQLSREIEKRPANRQYPQLSDMKESGDLEANADMVWGLWRKDREAEYARLECLKGRDIGTWTAWLRFDRFIQRFYDATEPHETPAETGPVKGFAFGGQQK